MIGSIREEHERRDSPPKLVLYFGGGGMRGSKESKARQRPMSMKILGRPSNMPKSLASSTIMAKSPRIWAWTSFEPNVMIIGYGHGNGVRRRGSVMPMINDAGSDDSALGNTCSGLRRKPIPIERFLRGGV